VQVPGMYFPEPMMDGRQQVQHARADGVVRDVADVHL